MCKCSDCLVTVYMKSVRAARWSDGVERYRLCLYIYSRKEAPKQRKDGQNRARKCYEKKEVC